MNNNNSNMSLLDEDRSLLHAYFDAHLPPPNTPPTRLHTAMRYAVINGGKRIRPLLAIAAYRAVGGTDSNNVLPIACAIELVHAYSLIHDDLPCMDDDDMRRGKPSCHAQFDQPTALLAGDALLTLAFEWCTHACPDAPDKSIEIIGTLARAAGSKGMCGGQQVDMEAPPPNEKTLAFIHNNKTAKLFMAALVCGANVTKITESVHTHVNQIGYNFGVAFQYIDDLLDVYATRDEIGKTPGKDAKNSKVTALSLFGVEKTCKMIHCMLDTIDSDIQKLSGDTQTLLLLTSLLRKRFQSVRE